MAQQVTGIPQKTAILVYLFNTDVLAAGKRAPRIAEPVDIEKMLDWLAEIWLDPEVRDGVEAESWLKLYESLKE